jgi:hypothetical protein
MKLSHTPLKKDLTSPINASLIEKGASYTTRILPSGDFVKQVLVAATVSHDGSRQQTVMGIFEKYHPDAKLIGNTLYILPADRAAFIGSGGKNLQFMRKEYDGIIRIELME